MCVSLSLWPYRSLDFGHQITCKTGPYKNLKVPSGPLRVTVKYGESTSIVVSDSTFTYAINPKITKYNPQASFVWLVNMQNIYKAGLLFYHDFLMHLLVLADYLS